MFACIDLKMLRNIMYISRRCVFATFNNCWQASSWSLLWANKVDSNSLPFFNSFENRPIIFRRDSTEFLSCKKLAKIFN